MFLKSDFCNYLKPESEHFKKWLEPMENNFLVAGNTEGHLMFIILTFLYSFHGIKTYFQNKCLLYFRVFVL